MPIIPWNCAHGDAPWVTIPCAPTVDLGAVDSNRVIVTGRGTVTSLGLSPSHAERGVPCTKTVYFEPSGIIIIEPGPNLALLGDGARVITDKAFAVLSCDGFDHWTENLCESLSWGPNEIDELIDIMYEMSYGPLKDRIRNLLRKRGLIKALEKKWKIA